MNTEIYNGLPSRILPQRPFLSIIIPCYNSRNTIGALLDSIIAQNMNDEIEVILSDDHSTESYQDIVDPYKEILSIRQVITDYNFAPGNTREKGVSVAEGIWITFADHDDEYIPNTLYLIKEDIIKSRENRLSVANFVEYDVANQRVKNELVRTRNWNHAKFYNLDNLWKANDIHFKKDLLTHEDIYISSVINCLIPDDEIHFVDVFCYKWNSRPTTISREKYGDRTFMETFFEDYIASTGQVYLDWVNKVQDTNPLRDMAIEVILFCYFYLMGFMFNRPYDYLTKNENACREYIVKVKETFGLTNKYIYDYAEAYNCKIYMAIRKSAYISVGYFIETYTLRQFLDYMHKDITPRITMKDSMHK